jgi:hypothetical protein
LASDKKEDDGRDKMGASISTAKQVFISRRGSPGFFPSSIASGKGLAKGLSVGSESIDLWRKPFSIFFFISFYHCYCYLCKEKLSDGAGVNQKK